MAAAHSSSLPDLRSTHDVERVLEFEFVRATENAALQAIHWLGRGDKESADAAACSAIAGVFDLLDVRGEVVIGEGIIKCNFAFSHIKAGKIMVVKNLST